MQNRLIRLVSKRTLLPVQKHYGNEIKIRTHIRIIPVADFVRIKFLRATDNDLEGGNRNFTK